MSKSTIKNDQYFMMIALKEAKKAAELGEVPVGCVMVKDGEIIAKAYNTREKTKDVLGHAEISVIRKASKKLGAWILDDCTMYVTLEPCLMCAGAILQARLKRIVFATKEPKFGALESVANVFEDNLWNHVVEVESGIFKEEASALLKSFFHNLRSSK